MFNNAMSKKITNIWPAISGPASRFIIMLSILFTVAGCDEATMGDGAAASGSASTKTLPLLEVSQAKIRGLLPGRNMTAAYFTLKNNKPTAVTLSGANSSSASAVEMHTVEMVAEQMRMRPLAEIVIEPGQSATFVSGSHHLMLFDVAKIEASMTITLQFKDGTELPVEFSKVNVSGSAH
jgi:hypothetical protein